MERNIWIDFDTTGLLIIFSIAVIIYVGIFLILLERNGMIRALAAATGAWLSTMVAFRWIWSRRYEWVQYLVSLRPMFQTIAFMYIIIGPIPPLMGMTQYLSNYGVKDLYWVLYLASPLAFLAYEYGYELGIGKLGSEIKLPSLKSDIKFPSSMIFVVFLIVVSIYYYMSMYVGFYAAGFKRTFVEEQGEFVKALGFLFNGFASVAILLAFNNYGKKGLAHKLFGIIVIITIIVFVIFMHNRRMAICFGIICLCLIQMIRKIKFIKAAIFLAIPIMLIYVITTSIRVAMPSKYDEAGVSFMDKLASSREVLSKGMSSQNLVERSLKVDMGYRLDAFDASAGILKSHETEGVPYMWGEHFLTGAHQSLPGIMAMTAKEDPEQMVNNHFGLVDFDQLTTLYSSSIADCGILGIPLAFLVFGLGHAYLWRQWSKKKISGVIAWGAKCSYFAILPYLLSFENYTGTYLTINLRYWVIYMIIFTSILGCYAIFTKKDFMGMRRIA
jgi:hypothetical protein